MKKYGCNGGTIMIGTKESRASFPNGFGDGEFEVSVVKDTKDKESSISRAVGSGLVLLKAKTSMYTLRIA